MRLLIIEENAQLAQDMRHGMRHGMTSAHDMLERLIKCKRKVISKSCIQNNLPQDVSSNAVEIHVHRARKSLESPTSTVRIETIRRAGYRLSEHKKKAEASRSTASAIRSARTTRAVRRLEG